MLIDEPIWHTLSPQIAADTLSVDLKLGLEEGEATDRLARLGDNRLIEATPRPVWLKFLDQFRNLLVIVLLFAAALSWAISDIKDAAVILVVVLFNAGLGFYQEHRAEQTLAALKSMLAARARVRRNARIEEIDAVHLT
jgi:Ca2+-transporting ATPase